MTKEEKELLLKDLCARLPYGVQCEVGGRHYGPYTFVGDDVEDLMEGRMFKPYLRHMSSMTDEEIDAMWDIYENDAAAEGSSRITDLLNERHLDHHHLIEQGLAIEVTEKNNPYKD